MKRFLLTLLTLILFLSDIVSTYAQSRRVDEIRPEQTVQSTINTQETFLSGLKDTFNALIDTAGDPFPSGEPDSGFPVNQTVKPNFSSLVTEITGISQSHGYITDDGILMVQTEGQVGFAVNAASSSGILSKASEIGVFSTGGKFGIISEAAVISSYASALNYGLYVDVPLAKIGIKSVSDSGYGTNASGQYGAYAFGTYGLLSYGKTEGVIGYFKNNLSETWGALGYLDGTRSYGFYTPNDTFVNDNLFSGVISVGSDQTGTSFVDEGNLTVFKDAYLDTIVTTENIGTISWNSSSDDVGILADYTEITGVLNAQNMTVSEGFYMDNGTLHVGTGWMKADQDFNIESGLNVLSGSVHSTGNIRANRIGSFYFRESALGSAVSKACDDINHLLVGCTGQIASIQDTPFGLQKVKPTSANTCSTSFYNATGYAYAYCFNPKGETTYSDAVSSINLEVPASAPAVDLRVNGSNGPVSVENGSSVTLSWTTTNDATSCVASNDYWDRTSIWSGGKDENGGLESIGPLNDQGSYSFGLICNNSGGADSDNVTVNVETDTPCEPWPNCVEPPEWEPPSDFGYIDFTPTWRWAWKVNNYTDPCFYDTNGCIPPVMTPRATDCASGSAFCPDNAIDYASWVDQVADAFNSILLNWDGTDPRNGKNLTGDLTTSGIAFLLDTARKDMNDFENAGVSESKINDALDFLSEYHQGSNGWENGASGDYDELIEDAYGAGYIEQDAAVDFLVKAGYSQTDIDNVVNNLREIDLRAGRSY